ncbi:hypothetical protein SUGI_0724930 [Cryptomeria japonica]|nr:hypothetical protein SUGI_0724930 [Cryptomeria japonica]
MYPTTPILPQLIFDHATKFASHEKEARKGVLSHIKLENASSFFAVLILLCKVPSVESGIRDGYGFVRQLCFWAKISYINISTLACDIEDSIVNVNGIAIIAFHNQRLGEIVSIIVLEG